MVLIIPTASPSMRVVAAPVWLARAMPITGAFSAVKYSVPTPIPVPATSPRTRAQKMLSSPRYSQTRSMAPITARTLDT